MRWSCINRKLNSSSWKVLKANRLLVHSLSGKTDAGSLSNRKWKEIHRLIVTSKKSSIVAPVQLENVPTSCCDTLTNVGTLSWTVVSCLAAVSLGCLHFLTWNSAHLTVLWLYQDTCLQKNEWFKFYRSKFERIDLLFCNLMLLSAF